MASIPSFTIINWNANGLRSKLAELIYFAQRRNSHIITISETRLSSKNNVYIPGYVIFRADGISPQRGVLLAIKTDLEPEQVSLPNNLGHLECIAAKINSPQGRIMITCVYNSPARVRPLEVNSLRTIFNQEARVIISGDLNARHTLWGCKSSNDNGRNLLTYCMQHGIEIVYPDEPTRYPTTSRAAPSVLDLVLVKGMSSATPTAISWHELSSDHNPVVVRFRKNVLIKKHTTWDVKRANWKNYRRRLCELCEIPTEINSPQHLDKLVESLTNDILVAARDSIPKKKVEFLGDQLPDSIRELIRVKNRARRNWNRYRDPAYHSEWNRLIGEVRYAVAQWRQKLWLDRISRLSNVDCSLWQFAKRLKGKKVPIGPLQGLQGLVYSPIEKAEMLADAYESQFTNLRPSSTEEILLEMEQAGSQSNSDEELFPPPIKPKNIKLAIKRVKLRKAPGHDGVLPIFVRNLPGKVHIILARIFQAIFDLKYFPSSWKLAEIIPVLKPCKDSRHVESYRPISLLSVLAKLAERFILDWLENEVEKRNILPNWQFGFRKRHSAVQQVARVVSYIKGRRMPTALVMLDVAKAFDSVWHFGLIAKLIRFGLPMKLCDTIKDFLANRKFRVRVNKDKSQWKQIRAGTPQGALLSPLLYALYTADIPTLRYAQIAQFADDTALFYSHRDARCLVRRIQEDLETVSEYLESWKLGLNKDKTDAILFTRKTRLLRNKIKLDDRMLDWNSSAKYLGVHLDKSLNWATHLKAVSSSGRIAAKIIWPLINKRSPLELDQKLNLYKAMVRPRLTYGAPLWWGHAAKTNVSLIERVETKTLRTIANPPPGINNYIIRAGLQIESLQDYIQQLKLKFHKRLITHTNPLITSIDLK